MTLIDPGAEYETDPAPQEDDLKGPERAYLRVNLPKGDHEALLRYAADHDLTLPKAIAQLLLTSKQPRPQYIASTGKPSLDEAAERFLEELEEPHIELLRECAMDRECRVADFLLSAIKLTHERGETAYVAFDEGALRVAASAPTPASASTCQWCGTSFTPSRRGQVYCPGRPGEVPCSRQAMLAEVHKKERPLGANVPLVSRTR